MKNETTNLYGLLAEFGEPEKLTEAARRAREAGYENLQAYTPFAVEGLSEFVRVRRRNWIPVIVLIGGIVGGLGGFLMQVYYMAISYPLNIGGRPLVSWAAFIPITFELTVLGAALFGAFGMFILNGLPQPFHPVFTVPQFRAASDDKFFLSIEASDTKFDETEARGFLESLQPTEIIEVWDIKR
jgi:hypothetical protein